MGKHYKNGKIGFFLSLVPIATIIVLMQLHIDTLEYLRWPSVVLIIILALLASILSFISLKSSKNKAWAIGGLTIGGLELLYMLVCLVHLGVSS